MWIVSDNTLGIGVVGKPQVMQFVTEIPQARYVAGCDLDESACAEARDKFGVATYTDYRDLIANPDVDMVFVKTPNHVHKDPTIAALSAGKHVFCEKPLALTMDACREMVAAARGNKRKLQIDLELRSSAIPRRMKQIVDSGELGEVRRILFHHYQGPWDQGPNHWRMNLETSGGIYLEKLVHEVDVFRWVAGEVEAVQSFYADPVLPQSVIPDCLQSMFWFANGAVGSMLHTQTRSAINVSPDTFHDYGHELWFDIVGTKGSLRADHWTGVVDVYHLVPGQFPGSRTVHFARREDYAGLGTHALGHDTGAHLTEFVRRVLADEPELQSPDDVLKTMAVAFAAEQSVRTRERVPVTMP